MFEYARSAVDAWPARDHRRRRRRRPPPGHDRVAHAVAGDRRAGARSSSSTGSTRCCRSCRCPNGIPVATVGVGKARNAALLAVRILGAHDDGLRARMEEFQAGLAETVREKDAKLRDSYVAVVVRRALLDERGETLRGIGGATTPRRSRRLRGARCVSSVSSRLVCTSRFAAASAPRGPSASRTASVSASACTSSSGTTLVMRPQSSASSALSTRFVSVSSSARRTPDEARHEPARRAVGGEPDAGVRHHELRRLAPRRRGRTRRRSRAPRPPRCRAPRRPPARRPARGGRSPVCSGRDRPRMLAGSSSPSAANAFTSPPPQNRGPLPDRSTTRTRSSRLIASGGGEEVAGQAVVDAVGGLGAVQREVGDPVAHLEVDRHVGTACGRDYRGTRYGLPARRRRPGGGNRVRRGHLRAGGGGLSHPLGACRC